MFTRNLVFVLPLLLACSEDPPPLFVSTTYDVSCDIMRGCPMDLKRSISKQHGEGGTEVKCSGVRGADGNVNITFGFTAVTEDEAMTDFGFEIRNLRVPAAGGPPLGTCQFILTEGASTYEGTCGSSISETAGVQCKVSNVAITDEREGRSLQGDLLCVGLPSRADRTLLREVTGPNLDPNAGDAAAAQFRFLGCAGI
jgi:hypothetical protein